jgi:hypothetical protein
MDISGETMFDIRISSRHEPSSPQLYLVVIQIEVKDEDFKQKLIRLGETKNIRLKCENNGILRNAFGLNDLDVDIVRDDERSEQLGYLDELIEKGTVFKFEIQDDAMVFMKKAKKVLSEYLESRFDLYRSQTNSGGTPLPQINVRKNLFILFGVVAGVIVILMLTRLIDSGDNYKAASYTPATTSPHLTGDTMDTTPIGEEIFDEDIETTEEILKRLYNSDPVLHASNLVHEYFGETNDFDGGDSIIGIEIFDDATLEIRVYAQDNISNSFIRTGFQSAAFDVMYGLKDRDDIGGVDFFISFPMQNQYGEEFPQALLARIKVSVETLSRLVWENLTYADIPEFADEYWEHRLLNE